MKSLRIFLLLGTITSNAFCQIDSLVTVALSKVFADTSISKVVFTNSYQNENAAYIYFNRTFEGFVFEYRPLHIKMTSYEQGKTKIFDVDGKPVYLFNSVVILGSLTDGQVDKVVVIDRFRWQRHSAKIRMHTTSLDSKRWHKNHGTERFVKISCLVTRSGDEWKVDRVEIKKRRFKALPDA